MPRPVAVSGCNMTSGSIARRRRLAGARCWVWQNSVGLAQVSTGGQRSGCGCGAAQNPASAHSPSEFHLARACGETACVASRVRLGVLGVAGGEWHTDAPRLRTQGFQAQPARRQPVPVGSQPPFQKSSPSPSLTVRSTPKMGCPCDCDRLAGRSLAEMLVEEFGDLTKSNRGFRQAVVE